MTELIVMSFAYAREEPPEANLVVDMRFLRNPHWQDDLRAMSGLDASVGAYIAGDPAYHEAMSGIEGLLGTLLPLYLDDKRRQVRIAFGCTGGRHRSVHVAEEVAARLRAAGFSPRLLHRDLAAPPQDGPGDPQGARTDGC